MTVPLLNACRILAAIGCLSVLAFAAPAPAQEVLRSEPLYATLNLEADNGGSKKILNIIERDANNLNARSIIMQWLKDRIWTRLDPDPFYSLYYSDLLFTTAQAYDRAGKPEGANALYPTSFLFLSVFEAMALTDSARCDDPTVFEPVQILIAGRYAYFQRLMDRLPADIKQKAKNLALSYEEKLAGRPPFSLICNSGLKAMAAALDEPNHTDKTQSAPGMLGGNKTTITPSKPYVPSFISNEVWNQKRHKIRQMLKDRP
jgi:hypothetical protein